MRHSVFSVLALVSVSSVLACSSAPETLAPLAADGGPTAVGSNASPGPVGADGGPSVPQGKPAEPPAEPTKAEQITEQFGIFVAKDGSASAPGTRAEPLSSLTDAMAKAKAAKKRVFVCEGIYEESLELESGVSIVGGLDCATATWKLTEKRSVLKSPVSPAIHAVSITVPTRIDNFDIEAPDATDASGSSVAVLAVDSNALTFAKGSIQAGSAMKGDDGVEGEQLTFRIERAAQPGAPARQCLDSVTQSFCPPTPQVGGLGGMRSCLRPSGQVAMTSEGGAGGLGGIYRRLGGAFPTWSVDNGIGSTDGAMGIPSAAGINGTNGVSAGVGTVSAAGYVAADGTNGTSGTAGRSGRGGNGMAPLMSAEVGSRYWGSAGAGGGPGGCPGLVGMAGKGGGASFGVLGLRSPIRFDGMLVASASGGAGGRGTFGSLPTEGGLGADIPVAGDTNRAEWGGTGGHSGISGNGAGGPSIAISHQGGAPILTQTNTKVGAGGAGVEARSQGGKTIPASPTGASEGVKAL